LKVFDALMTAGATLGLGATGFFVMLAGYQYMSAAQRAHHRFGQEQSVQRLDRSRHRHHVQGHCWPGRWRLWRSWRERKHDDWLGARADTLMLSLLG